MLNDLNALVIISGSRADPITLLTVLFLFLLEWRDCRDTLHALMEVPSIEIGSRMKSGRLFLGKYAPIDADRFVIW